MSPLSGKVIAAATLVSSPALWLALVDRTLPLDVALTRYLVALVLCWGALSVVATWAFPDAHSLRLQREAAEKERSADAASDPDLDDA